MTFGYKAVVTATTDWQQVIYILYMCERARPRQERVGGGGGGDTYIIDYTMELPFMNKYTFTAGGGGGGRRKQDIKEMGGGTGVCNYGKI
jgi:hypothetical protein